MSGAGGPTGSRRDESNGQARTGEPSGSWRADGMVVQGEVEKTERSRADKRGAGAETAQVEVRDGGLKRIGLVGLGIACWRLCGRRGRGTDRRCWERGISGSGNRRGG